MFSAESTLESKTTEYFSAHVRTSSGSPPLTDGLGILRDTGTETMRSEMLRLQVTIAPPIPLCGNRSFPGHEGGPKFRSWWARSCRPQAVVSPHRRGGHDDESK